MNDPLKTSNTVQPLTRKGDWWLGIFLILIGGGIIAVGQGWIPSDPKSFHAPRWVVTACGGIFSAAGLSFLFRHWPSIGAFLAAGILTGFASIGLWVGFGPGVRHFQSSGSLSFLFSEKTSEAMGGWAFGLGGILIAVFALYAWSIFLKNIFLKNRLLGFFAFMVLIGISATVLHRWWNSYNPSTVALNESAPDAWDDLYFEAFTAKLKSPTYLEWKKGHQSWLPYQEFEEERKLQAIRSAVAARVVPPAGTIILKIPEYFEEKLSLSRDFETVMQRGLHIQPNAEPKATLSLLANATHLWIAFDATGETTPKGFDQARFFYHINLLPSLPWEAVYQSSTGNPSLLRSGPESDSKLFPGAEGTSTLDGHRRYLISLPLESAGLHPGVPFAARAEIETDPLLYESGKFKNRVHLAEFGMQETPLWLVIGEQKTTSNTPLRATNGSLKSIGKNRAQSDSEAEQPNPTSLKEALEIKLASKSYERWKRTSRPPQNLAEESPIKDFRNNLISQRKENSPTVTIPLCSTAPLIDGTLTPNEWSGAQNRQLHSTGTTLSLLADSEWLYIGITAPKDTTTFGWDQLRVYFHHQLIPEFHHERFHLSPGSLTSIREIKLPMHKYPFADYHILNKSRGFAGFKTHRQYELAIDRAETGIPANTPIAFSLELETDPKEINGKRERVSLGEWGSKTEPVWLIVP